MTEKKIKQEVIDELMKEYRGPEDFQALFTALKKAVMERALKAELDVHLGYEKGQEKPADESNHRNGSSSKTVLGESGAVRLEIPRDPDGTFDPKLIRKHQRRIDGMDQKILSMYARGMTVREIQGHLKELYATDISPDLISSVTDEVIAEVREWQSRPLETLYPVIILDALRVKIRDEGVVKNKAVYLALGITLAGTKDILGLWIEQTEGAKFWLKVMTELKNRGVQDVLICLVDGLKGFPEAIEATFPQAQIQTCIVHLMRHSLEYCSWQDRKQVAHELKAIYRESTAEAAEQALARFAAGRWGQRYPPIVTSWRRNWERVIPFFVYPLEVRRVLYTTNAIESLNMQLRKITKNRGHFPSDEAATKLLYLALRNATAKWKNAGREWKPALTQFAILYPERFTAATDRGE
ncbi:MAG TPA: IS256 family transposase [Pyrinomonadaceae bacterium]|jgi:putative transposase|nr:IS256 family transposase [Pyrinomonadaceae bacterium]